ncbi:MAG: hypothetical protein K6U04_15295 [Armatimonadetes bacterium]|nr:hypothetical protein [Armatimonadota bacterium]
MHQYFGKFLAVMVVFTLLTSFAGCSRPEQAKQEIKPEKVEQKIKEELGKGVQEALRNPEQPRDAQGNVTARHQLGEEFTIPFRVSKWESEGKKVSRECKSRVKINGWEMRDKAGTNTPKNGAFLLVNITIAGDADLKDFSPQGTFLVVSPTVDTAEGPKFSVVDAGGSKYVYDFRRGVYFNNSPPRDLGSVFVVDPNPKTLNLPFDVPPGIAKPRLRIEFIKISNQKEIIEVDLGSPAGNK